MVDPINEDPGYSDGTTEPSPEAKSSRWWLAQITTARKAFEDYQDKADRIDKLYADLNQLSSNSRDREFALFWANIQVLGPSIYSRTPVPVVTPKFKDRRPLYRLASELLERCSIVTLDLCDVNSVMLLLRDDLAIQARGVAWVRYETKGENGEGKRVVPEHLDRKDFLHEPARNWLEVGWVARRAWLTKKQARKRFNKPSGDAYKDAAYVIQKEDRDNGAADHQAKAGFWEIWSKTDDRCYWVAEGCDKLLDEGEPHLKLEGFFPCPKPAYGTTQRRSLVPVPDMLYYRDQLEEINKLTGRVHALLDAVKVKGFYPAGAGELGDAIQQAFNSLNDNQIVVGISNWAAFGSTSGDPIVWLPIDMIVATILQLLEMRRQTIDDVYQIMGLSDIMRGSSEAQETLGAQQLKAQYGSVRIRDKRDELVRIARDIVRIAAEIMAEEFDKDTLLDMSQMEIETDADVKKQIAALKAQANAMLEQQISEAMNDPEAAQMAQQNPAQAKALIAQAEQQIMGQVQPQIDMLEEKPTVEKVMKFLKDNRIRPFVLDIETDSTIQPDENAEKQRRAEFLQAMGGAIAQLGGLVAQEPAAGPFAANVLKFALAPYRAGRELEGAVDEFADALAAKAKQPQPNPEAMKAEAEAKAQQAQQQIEAQNAAAQQAKTAAEAEKTKADAMKTQAEAMEKAQQAQQKGLEAQDAQAKRQAELQASMAAADLQRTVQREKADQDAAKSARELQKLDRELELLGVKIVQAEVQTENAIATTEAGIAATAAKASQPNAGAP